MKVNHSTLVYIVYYNIKLLALIKYKCINYITLNTSYMCLVDINDDSQEDDDTLIDQLGGYVVPPLIVEPDVSVTIPVNAQIVNNPLPIQYEVCI